MNTLKQKNIMKTFFQYASIRLANGQSPNLLMSTWSIFILLALAITTPAYAESTLNNVSVATMADDRVQVAIEFDRAPNEPLAFAIDNPARIALDFANTGLGNVERFQDVNIGNTRSISIAQANDRTRLVVNLAAAQEFQTSVKGNTVFLTIGETISSAAPVKPVKTTITSASSGGAGKNSVGNIDFRRGEGGAGRLMIGLASPDTIVNVDQQGGRIILSMPNVTLSKDLQKRYDVSDFATPVQTVEAFNKGSGSQIIVTPDSTIEFEHLAYQSDNLYVLEVSEIPDEIIETRRRETYSGERLSLNFQNIEVRSVLQLIADFTGLNLVVSDSVGGSLTLRLKNVPWDQALSIILKTRGLDMRENGNVIYIAPSEEIAAREKLELESQQQVEELAPLRSEFLEINYARAADLAALLKDADNTLLSERGQVSVDERTNTLLIQDTAFKLNEIRRLIDRLDTPVKQVLIESRIVIADDNFSKELGVRFGANNIDSDEINRVGGITNDGTFKGVKTADVITGNLNTLIDIANGDDIELNDTLNVNLPVTDPAGQIALAVAKLPFGYLLELELSAAQQETRAEVISSPRVITANQATARIETGEEIPYQEATSSGATNIEFKKAVLALEVTPQITPDERVSMQLNVSNDSVGEIRGGVPSIVTNSIETDIMVDNGQTVVLGGIYEQNTVDSVRRVPFFSDIPLVGTLFRNTLKTDEKSELLIFITPKIINEELALTR